MGRLVITHSTYIEGLLKWGKKICDQKGIKTVTPGLIGRTKGKVNKLTFRVCRKTDNGYKLIARNKKSFQEIYIVSNLDTAEFKNLVENS
tara:strand:- start:760 stop:1029 length:270 start_codon:yes stop_codon:yes gene_type:complete